MTRFLAALFCCSMCGLLNGADAPPNFLLIIAEDCTYRDMEVYGGQAKA